MLDCDGVQYGNPFDRFESSGRTAIEPRSRAIAEHDVASAIVCNRCSERNRSIDQRPMRLIAGRVD